MFDDEPRGDEPRGAEPRGAEPRGAEPRGAEPRGAEPRGATPIDPDEAEGLIPGHIQTRAELNEWEQANIIGAARWVRTATEPALAESTILGLHKRMFDRTWEWAGRYRTSDKNIGVCWAEIGVEIGKFVDDGAYWLEHHVSSVDEAAVRLHHRLVLIHPFPDGNGRHARLWCDLLLRQNGRPMFSWSSEELDRASESRRRYIDALRRADGGDFEPLFCLLLRNRD